MAVSIGVKSSAELAIRACNPVICSIFKLRLAVGLLVMYSTKGVLKLIENAVPWNESVTTIAACLKQERNLPMLGSQIKRPPRDTWCNDGESL